MQPKRQITPGTLCLAFAYKTFVVTAVKQIGNAPDLCGKYSGLPLWHVTCKEPIEVTLFPTTQKSVRLPGELVKVPQAILVPIDSDELRREVKEHDKTDIEILRGQEFTVKVSDGRTVQFTRRA